MAKSAERRIKYGTVSANTNNAGIRLGPDSIYSKRTIIIDQSSISQ